MRFEWDVAKNLSNQRKHGVSFEAASKVFDDPLHLSLLDHVVDEEQRWLTMGAVGASTILVVAHLYTDVGSEVVVRIISARKATRRERQAYENG